MALLSSLGGRGPFVYRRPWLLYCRQRPPDWNQRVDLYPSFGSKRQYYPLKVFKKKKKKVRANLSSALFPSNGGVLVAAARLRHQLCQRGERPSES